MAAGPACVAVKLQLACFERLGAPGWEALERTVAIARDHGLLVLADGKRGDVPGHRRAPTPRRSWGRPRARSARSPASGSTPSPPTRCSGATRSSPLIDGRRRRRRGAASCWCAPPTRARPSCRTRAIRRCTSGWRALTDELGEAHVGDCGLSLVGAVTGATQPGLLGRLRELMPRAVFLLPGVGAQGGRVEDLAAAFEPHPAAGLVTASRSIVNAHASAAGTAGGRRGAAAEDLRAAPGTCRASKLRGAQFGGEDRCNGGRRRSAARLLAPLALLLAVVAVLLVIQATTESDDSKDDTAETTETDQRHDPDHAERSPRVRPTYTVKLNDTSALISEKTGVPVERIQDAQPRAGPAEPDRRPEDQAARVRRAATLLLALCALAAPAQAGAADRPPAVPNAKAAIVIDGRNGEVMFAKHRGLGGRSRAPPS